MARAPGQPPALPRPCEAPSGGQTRQPRLLGDNDQEMPLMWGLMTPATDVDAKAAVERFARLPEGERAAIMARGRLIQSVEDLDGLSDADVERLRPIIEG